MPCTVWEDHNPPPPLSKEEVALNKLKAKVNELRKKADDATHAACDACKYAIKIGGNPSQFTLFLKGWWGEHQTMDEKRLKDEQSQARTKAKKLVDRANDLLKKVGLSPNGRPKIKK